MFQIDLHLKLYVRKLLNQIMPSVKSYFDNHGEYPSYRANPEKYVPIMNHIMKIKSEERLKIFDFGCGNGNFIKGMKETSIDADFYGSDISPKMISLATNNIKDQEVVLFVADGLNMPINSDIKFDLIHVNSVLHHIIGKTRNQSFNLVGKMIGTLMNLLSEDGSILIEEFDIHSYFFSEFTSS